MLKDVLKTIEEKSREERKKLESQKEAKLKELEKEFKEDLEEKRESQKTLLKKETGAEILEERKKQELKARFALEEKKAQLLDLVYKEAKNRILEQKSFSSLVASLLEALPKKEGFFSAGKRTAEVLKRKGFPVKEITGQEGFVFKSRDLDIDCSLNHVLSRERLDPELIKILYV